MKQKSRVDTWHTVNVVNDVLMEIINEFSKI